MMDMYISYGSDFPGHGLKGFKSHVKRIVPKHMISYIHFTVSIDLKFLLQMRIMYGVSDSLKFSLQMRINYGVSN